MLWHNSMIRASRILCVLLLYFLLLLQWHALSLTGYCLGSRANVSIEQPCRLVQAFLPDRLVNPCYTKAPGSVYYTFHLYFYDTKPQAHDLRPNLGSFRVSLHSHCSVHRGNPCHCCTTSVTYPTRNYSCSLLFSDCLFAQFYVPCTDSDW